jgi:3'(2'), 5'-bisphosphate nucleotidase
MNVNGFLGPVWQGIFKDWVLMVPSDLEISKFTDERCVEQITAIVSQAAATILTFDPATAPRRTKHDRSPVSDADEAANAILIEGLSRLFPGMPIVSEEAKFPEITQGQRSSCFALVDPLDGTREFLASRNEFTVNVALVCGGLPVLGVIAAPKLARVWRGVTGSGAERLTLAPGAEPREAVERQSIKTRRRRVEEGLTTTVSRSHLDKRTTSLLAALPITAQIPSGSALKFCRLAEGIADFYPRLAPTHEWDVAAGHAIVVAAGGTVIAPDGGPIAYGRAAQNFIVPEFLALGDPELATAVLPLTASR